MICFKSTAYLTQDKISHVSMTDKPKGVQVVNGAMLNNYTLMPGGTKEGISQGNFFCNTIDTFLLSSLSDNRTAAESLELTDNRRNLNYSWFVPFPHLL